MTEPGDENIKNKDRSVGTASSKEWQAAKESIFQILSSSRHLIEMSSKNKQILDERRWKSVLRNSQSPKSEEFSAIYGEAFKGPNGETLKIGIFYSDELTDNPDFLQVYGDSQDGFFSFSFYKNSPGHEPEEFSISYDKDQWRIRVSCPQGDDTPPNELLFDYNAEFELDSLLVRFDGLGLKFDEQGDIHLPKDKASISTSLHFPYNSIRRDDVTAKERERVMGFLKEADKMRKKELGENPIYTEDLKARIGFVPPDNYAQVQQERINTLPTRLSWFEGLNIVNERIRKTISVFESTLQA